MLTGRAYATSAEIAGKSGAFPGYKPNAEAMLRVMRNHKRAADGEVFGYESLSVRRHRSTTHRSPRPARPSPISAKPRGPLERGAGAR